jgi:hypothetical protein
MACCSLSAESVFYSRQACTLLASAAKHLLHATISPGYHVHCEPSIKSTLYHLLHGNRTAPATAHKQKSILDAMSSVVIGIHHTYSFPEPLCNVVLEVNTDKENGWVKFQCNMDCSRNINALCNVNKPVPTTHDTSLDIV